MRLLVAFLCFSIANGLESENGVNDKMADEILTAADDMSDDVADEGEYVNGHATDDLSPEKPYIQNTVRGSEQSGFGLTTLQVWAVGWCENGCFGFGFAVLVRS